MSMPLPPVVETPSTSGRRPLTLESSSILRIVTLCALYMAQGLPYGFITITVIGVLTRDGATPLEISGLLIMVGLPWTFKWLWGPLIDTFGVPSMGRRRPWILLAQSMVVLILVIVGLSPGLVEDLNTLGLVLFILNCFVSLQDVSVDALAVDLLEPEERGRVNGLMYGSNYGGLALGGAVLGLVAAAINMQAAFLVLALCIGLIMLLPMLLRERHGDRLFGFSQLPRADGGDPPLQQAATNSALDRVFGVLLNIVRAFMTVPTCAGIILAVLASMSTGLFAVYFPKLMLEEIEWKLEAYTTVQGLVAFVGLGGAVLGGFLADIVGPRRLAAVTGLSSAVLWIIFALTPGYWVYDVSMVTMMILETALGGMFSVSLFALFMGVSWKLVAATQFTAYMALLNVSRIIGNSLGGSLEGRVTFSDIYLLAALMITTAVAILPLVSPFRAQRSFKRYQAEADPLDMRPA